MLHSLFERELHEYAETDDGPVSVKISFTGMASANIDGRTYHSFLGIGKAHGKNIGIKEMQSVAKAAARDKHKSLKIIIEDEMSLGSLAMNNFMNDYFNLIFDVPDKDKSSTFYNNISVIKVGDFMQLNLFGTPIYGNPKNDSYEYFRPNIWKKNFTCFELTECMRQKGDDGFIKILNTARYMTFPAGSEKLEEKIKKIT